MDLKTIDSKIKSHQYNNKDEFDVDVRKIIANSYILNSRQSAVYELTKQFQNYYD